MTKYNATFVQFSTVQSIEGVILIHSFMHHFWLSFFIKFYVFCFCDKGKSFAIRLAKCVSWNEPILFDERKFSLIYVPVQALLMRYYSTDGSFLVVISLQDVITPTRNRTSRGKLQTISNKWFNIRSAFSYQQQKKCFHPTTIIILISTSKLWEFWIAMWSVVSTKW